MQTLPGDPDQRPSGWTMWPDAREGPWRIRVTWEVQRGVPVPVSLTIDGSSKTQESQVLEARLLRQMPIGRLIEETRDIAAVHYRNQLGLFKEVFGLNTRGLSQELRDEIEGWHEHAHSLGSPKPARRGVPLSDSDCRDVANVYKTARTRGASPTKAVAESFHIAHTTAAKRVQQARRRVDPETGEAFLPPTTRGRPGPISQESS